MHPRIWMDDLFGSRARVRILRVLAKDPGRLWSERELAKAVGMSPNTVNVALRFLRDRGILTSHLMGQVHAVGLRRDLRLSGYLRRAFDAETATWEGTLGALRRAVPLDAVCYLFGSSARGAPTTDSDLDLLVVASTRERAEAVASELRGAVLRVLPARVQVVALGKSDLRSPRHRKLVAAVLREGMQLSAKGLEALR